MKQHVFALTLLVLSMNESLAQSVTSSPRLVPCISADFSSDGGSYWRNIALKLTNHCDQPADLQHAHITFINTSELHTTFWGNFSPLTYPNKSLDIHTQKQDTGDYLASISLEFPTENANTILAPGYSISINYGEAEANYVANSVHVYLNSAVNNDDKHATSVPITQHNMTIRVQGAPASSASSQITLSPSHGLPIQTVVTLNQGVGEHVVSLPDGSTYNIYAEPIDGYRVKYTSQPLLSSANAAETVTYIQDTSTHYGRVIAYLPGWKTPPPAADIAKAGYTHVIIAFGVFSTQYPGRITPAFDTITKDYIKALQHAGVRVLLSLGGASSSLKDTTVDFHQALSLAPSPIIFAQTCLNSLGELIASYDLDGIDFDIEHGLNAEGTFTNPTGDIATLAGIINALHVQYPDLLITLAPQIANVAATSTFNATWGNYASLVMQTYQSLAWIGIQLYNAGCAYGVDLICYDPNNAASPDASVAIATDLLTNWPEKNQHNQSTGFQPYISYLTPSQIVLGYPASNASGQSDGKPAAVIPTIKRAITCLRTGIASPASCDTYIPPRTYPDVGGIFEWEITYDADNQYHFATSLKHCVIDHECE